MFQLINTIISEFRSCFKRKKAWNWFSCLIIGFIIRSDHRGVSSVVSWLRLRPALYHTALHFFRSSAYNLSNVFSTWASIICKYAPITEMFGRNIIIGDNTKISKEGLRMPLIQKHHQESGNSSKPEFIFGHNFGVIGILANIGKNFLSIPLIAEIQQGKKKTGGDSIVKQMISLAGRVVKATKKRSILLLDAYFCSNVTFEEADKYLDSDGNRLLDVITRAKRNTVAYELPNCPKGSQRGRKPKYGVKVVLSELFSKEGFTKTSLILYGKLQKVEFQHRDLLWRPTGKLIRFVLVKMGGNHVIFMSSDLTLKPVDIITLYCLRFKIEVSFDDLKNEMGAFDYHFWTKALPKRKRSVDAVAPTDEKSLQTIKQSKQAIEVFVCLQIIATGIISIIAFNHSQEIWKRFRGWLRTVRSIIPSIATTKSVIMQDFYTFLPQLQRYKCFKMIKDLQRDDDLWDHCA